METKNVEQRINELNQIVIKLMCENEALKSDVNVLVKNISFLYQDNIRIRQEMNMVKREMPSGNYGGMGMY